MSQRLLVRQPRCAATLIWPSRLSCQTAGDRREAAAIHWPRTLVTSGDTWSGGWFMPSFEELSWEEAMRRGHAALLDSERL